MTLDGTNLYFSESLDHGIQVVRRLDLSSRTITTVAVRLFTIAGTGNNSLNPLQPPTLVGCSEPSEEVLVRIAAPSAIAGNYLAAPAEFGSALSMLGITAELVEVDDGACSFVDQVKNVQNSGAGAAIVANPGDHIIVPMIGDDPTIAIPAASIGFEDASLIRAELAGGFQVTLSTKDCEIAGGVPAVQAVLTSPRGVAVDLAGNLFIADGPRIWRVDASDSLATILEGPGPQIILVGARPSTSSPFLRATGLAIEGDGDLYVADVLADSIFKIDAVSRELSKGPTLGWVNPLAFRRSLQEAWGTILV